MGRSKAFKADEKAGINPWRQVKQWHAREWRLEQQRVQTVGQREPLVRGIGD